MTKQDKETKKKLAEGKKAAREATKKASKNKLKKSADKMLMDMAADMPGNGGKFLLTCAAEQDKLDAESAKIRLAKKALRAKMKTEKVVLEVFDAVMKMRKREPEEQAAYRATEALYTQQLDMKLSVGQKAQIELLEEQRKKARAGMDEITGVASAGREVGSGTEPPKDEEEEEVVPLKNEALSIAAASAATH